MKSALLGGALVALIVCIGSVGGSAQVAEGGQSAAEPAAEEAAAVVLSAPQVTRGRQVAGQACSECHGVTLRGGMGPPLRDDVFLRTWSGRTADRLYEFIHANMPPATPGSLTEAEYVDIVTFILSTNGVATEEGAPEVALDDLGEVTIP